MGRHSAPDDEDQDLDVSGTLTAVRAEESPEGTTPRPGGRHSRGDGGDDAAIDTATDPHLVDPHAPTELFRPYTGVFAATPSSGATADVADVAEAHTTELPAVVDDAPSSAPSTATINGAGPVAEPGTDTADLGAPIDGPVLDLPPDLGPTDVEPTETVSGPPTDVEQLTPSDTEQPSSEQKSEDRPPTGTRADLALLRTHPGLRARAAAAVLAPFVLYVIVLALLARFDQALLWVWIPIIVAGVAFGLVLDLAQRAHDHQRTDTPDSSAP